MLDTHSQAPKVYRYGFAALLTCVGAMALSYVGVLIHPGTQGVCYDSAAYICIWFAAIFAAAPFTMSVFLLILYIS